MKYKTTMKAVLNGHSHTIRLRHCQARYLLSETVDGATAYTQRVEGWASDVYELPHGVAVSMGNSPFGDIVPDSNVVAMWEESAKIMHDNTLGKEWNDNTMAEYKAELYKIQTAFLQEVGAFQ